MVLMVFYAMGAKAIDDKRTFKIINASDGLIDNSAQTILCTESGRIIENIYNPTTKELHLRNITENMTVTFVFKDK